MTRALLILVMFAFIVVIGLSFVGGGSYEARPETVTPTEQPGYFLTGATITDTAEDGSPRVRIRAARIDEIPAADSVELTTLSLTYTATGERDWLVTADHGVVPESTKTVHLDGNVRIHGIVADTGPEAVIETGTLDFDTESSIARTNDDVRIVMGTRALTARGLNADLKQHRVRLESRVHGQFPPSVGR